jgi:hypothetical protein
MPILLPPKPRTRTARGDKDNTIAQIDWLGLWALSLGFCAIILAGIADFAGEDATGAAFILIGAAAIISLIVAVSGEADAQT